MEFDTIWMDGDDNAWAASKVEGGVKLFTIVSGDWVEVIMVPVDSWDDLAEEVNESSK